MKCLHLRLRGTQSWTRIGCDWYDKLTSDYPTKSAIAGIIAAGIGVPKNAEQEELLQSIANNITVYVKENEHGVRYDDHQTVKMWDIQAKGTVNIKENELQTTTKRRHKEYLVGADFDVYVIAPDEDLQFYMECLSDPVYVPYLGKKCCIPASCYIDPTNAVIDIKEEELHTCILV